MNQFIHFDVSSSSNHFAPAREASPFVLLEESVQPNFKMTPPQDDFIGMKSLKEHQLLRSNVEDELPKFHFPTPEPMLFQKQCDGKSGEYCETRSVNSTKSTRANHTKETSSFDELSGHGFNNFDINIDDLAEPKVENKEQVMIPTLEEIFNLKKSEETTEKSEVKTEEKTVEDINLQVESIIQTNKPVKKAKDLSKRGDVVNKTILRAMKRYYFTEFDSLYGFSNLSDKEKFAQFHELVRKFVTQEMKGCKDLAAPELEDAILFFGSMISHIHMRRGITVSKIRTQVNSVHKCLYSYSHKKLSQLMKQQGFKFVLGDFAYHGGIDIVLNSEETMLKQQDLYRDACEALLQKCQE